MVCTWNILNKINSFENMQSKNSKLSKYQKNPLLITVALQIILNKSLNAILGSTWSQNSVSQNTFSLLTFVMRKVTVLVCCRNAPNMTRTGWKHFSLRLCRDEFFRIPTAVLFAFLVMFDWRPLFVVVSICFSVNCHLQKQPKLPHSKLITDHIYFKCPRWWYKPIRPW